MKSKIQYRQKQTAVVSSFFPKRRYGFATDTSTGQELYFSMNQSQFFMASPEGPVFNGQVKNTWPKRGDILVYILDEQQPQRPDVRPSMAVWNFLKAFNECLLDCNSISAVAEIDNLRSSYVYREIHAPRHMNSPSPKINLVDELDQLARSIGGRNGNSRHVHQAAKHQSA